MNFSSRRFRAPMLAVAAILAAPVAASAAITGFGDFSQFTINVNDAGSPPSSPSAGTIQLTNGSNEVRSIFANVPQTITQFTASFTYQATNVDAGTEHIGVGFVIENDPRAASAIGVADTSSPPDGFGYQGIIKSVAVILDQNNLSLGNTATSLFTNGATSGGGSISTSPVNLDSGDPISVQLAYSGSALTETLTDTKTLATFSTSFLPGNIATIVGGNNAFVGVTAGNGFVFGNDFISNFQFTSAAPEPASLGVLGLGLTLLSARRRTHRR
ncbi:MAG TPA: PEP-CTERM sorting domain-containing protein [Phycisphaerae bacterium]|jgi:hypothetical protein|nr:PEP-CTERM sorting domain-containing protein [Phycisphaerae bacterium]